jgi:hypothetical protein
MRQKILDLSGEVSERQPFRNKSPPCASVVSIVLTVESAAVPPTPDLLIETLQALRVGYLARRSHPAARRKHLSFDDVAGYPVASTLLSEAHARAFVAQYGPLARPDESLSLVCEDIASLIEGVASTDAIYIGHYSTRRPNLHQRSWRAYLKAGLSGRLGHGRHRRRVGQLRRGIRSLP